MVTCYTKGRRSLMSVACWSYKTNVKWQQIVKKKIQRIIFSLPLKATFKQFYNTDSIGFL